MAGSGFPPLPNIPYCCLPQESGPCLSTSVGDRPLRSPSHRSLGGPSPRLQANGTHARPRPPRLWPPWDAPRWPHGVLSGVSTGCPPVGGWLHTRYAPVRHSQSPEGDFTVRLACIRPAASVHPEPGSNSSLYYCLCFLFSLNLGFRLSAHRCALLCSLLGSFSRHPFGCLCWPQTFKELSRSRLPSSLPLVPSESGCKSTTFFRTGKHFFQIFFIFFTKY